MASKKIHEDEGRKKVEVEGGKKKEESKQFSVVWVLVPDKLTLD